MLCYFFEAPKNKTKKNNSQKKKVGNSINEWKGSQDQGNNAVRKQGQNKEINGAQQKLRRNFFFLLFFRFLNKDASIKAADEEEADDVSESGDFHSRGLIYQGFLLIENTQVRKNLEPDSDSDCLSPEIKRKKG